MWRESIRLTQDYGEDSTAWVADWLAGNRPRGYKQRAVITQFTLMAFAGNESGKPDGRRQEVALGLAMLCLMSVDVDDEDVYESCDDKEAALTDILSSNREKVLDGVVAKVGAFGPEMVPALIERFDPNGLGWGHIRIAEAIAHIARRHPGSCDAAIPKLIDAINNEQGDFMLEACSDALGAIGPAAIEPIAPLLSDDDISRKIFLCAALGDIPTESSAQAILDLLDQGEPFDEMHANALLDIGDPSGIEPIRAAWEMWRTDYLAEYLLVLCRVNGIEHPDIPKWRDAVSEREERKVGRRAAFENAASAPAPALLPNDTQRASSKKKKGVGDAERKKRSAHRKMNARKKKK